MSGGYKAGNQASTELFLPSTGKSCPLQEGTARCCHTLDQLEDGSLLACGGYGDAEKICRQFVPSLPYGTWTMAATLRNKRGFPVSLVTGREVLLLGGYYSSRTTEVVGGDQSFNLQQSSQ